MLPSQLTADRFNTYPPKAREKAVQNLDLLKQSPLAFLPLLLRELMVYDWKFPAEQNELDRQFQYLRSLSSEQLSQVMAGFSGLKLSSDLEDMPWVAQPGTFSEKLSAHLWATHQIDMFHRCAETFVRDFNATVPEPAPSVPRLGVVLFGGWAAESGISLFRKLRRSGTYFPGVKTGADSSLGAVVTALAARARKFPQPYGHWYIDGNIQSDGNNPDLAHISYDALATLRSALLKKMRRLGESGAGPEAIRSALASTLPSEVGWDRPGTDPVLGRFAISLFTEGSGTQIFSTTFVQWAAREALRRAKPATLLVRFSQRQTESSADAALAGMRQQPVYDSEGSIVDADIGAYYTWLNMQRLPEAERYSFLAWFEGHSEAVAVGPAFKAGATSAESVDVLNLLRRMDSAL